MRVNEWNGEIMRDFDDCSQFFKSLNRKISSMLLEMMRIFFPASFSSLAANIQWSSRIRFSNFNVVNCENILEKLNHRWFNDSQIRVFQSKITATKIVKNRKTAMREQNW